MLQALRNQVSSWVVRAFLLLLVLSFAVWGIGDVFFGTPGGNVAAEVDGQPVSLIEVNRDFTNNLRQLQEQYGAAIDREGPLGAQLLNDALAQSVARRLVEVHASDLNLSTDDETVAETIRTIPAFQVAGQFSRPNFDFALQRLGFSEQDFIEDMRADLTRDRILRSLEDSVRLPEDLGIVLEKHRNEERLVTLLEVPYASIEVSEPDEATLAAYLEENSDSFRAPEYRTGAMLILSPDIVADDITVDEREVRALYDERRSQFSVPARRTVGQILAPSREAVEPARREALAGAEFEEIPDRLPENNLSFTEFEDLRPGDLPEVLDTMVWQTGTDEISQPVESDFGWHIFEIADEVPETVTPFDEVREQLARDLAVGKATDQLPDLAAALDDEIAAGNSLEEAGDSLDLSVIQFESVDPSGMGKNQNRAIPTDVQPEMLQGIFSAPADEVSLLEETADGTYYLYRVDTIEPERPYTHEEKRAEILAGWEAQQQRSMAVEEAQSLLTRAGEVATFEDLRASNQSLAIREVGPMQRDVAPSSAGLTAESVGTIFDTPTGSIAESVLELADSAAIVRVDTVEIPEIGSADPELMSELSQQFRNDLLAQYEQALRRRYPVSVNQAALANILQPNNP